LGVSSTDMVAIMWMRMNMYAKRVNFRINMMFIINLSSID